MDIKNMLKHIKLGQVVPPQIKNSGALAGNTYFDTQGLAGVLFLLDIGTTDVIVGSTDTDTPPYLEECDTSDGDYTAITEAELASVIAADDDNNIFGIHVDLTKTHKRYMRWNAPTAGNSTGANVSGLAIGFPADVLPSSASEMGLEEFVEA